MTGRWSAESQIIQPVRSSFFASIHGSTALAIRQDRRKEEKLFLDCNDYSNSYLLLKYLWRLSDRVTVDKPSNRAITWKK